jgi:hypothetical protein
MFTDGSACMNLQQLDYVCKRSLREDAVIVTVAVEVIGSMIGPACHPIESAYGLMGKEA